MFKIVCYSLILVSKSILYCSQLPIASVPKQYDPELQLITKMIVQKGNTAQFNKELNGINDPAVKLGKSIAFLQDSQAFYIQMEKEASALRIAWAVKEQISDEKKLVEQKQAKANQELSAIQSVESNKDKQPQKEQS